MVIAAHIRRCDRAGCSLPVKWQIALRVWRIGHDTKPREPDAKMLTGMCVCNKHKLDTKADDLLDDDNKLRLVEALRQRGFTVLPAFNLTDIEWIKLRSPKQINSNSWARFTVIDNEERRAHQCHFDGCDSEAIWDTHLLVMGTELRAETTIRVCDKHQDAASAFLLNEHNTTNLMRMLAENGIFGVHPGDLRVAFGRWEKQH